MNAATIRHLNNRLTLSSEEKPRSIVKSHREAVEREIPVFPYPTLDRAIKNVSGLFIKAVEESYEVPKNYLDSVERKLNQKTV
jgi:hypothetical protein